MWYDIIFTTITQIIHFSSPIPINLVLPIPILLSYSLLKRQGACLLGIERGNRRKGENSHCILGFAVISCVTSNTESQCPTKPNINFSLTGLQSALVALFQALDQIPVCSRCLSFKDLWLGFLFSQQKAGRSEHKRPRQTVQVYLKPL